MMDEVFAMDEFAVDAEGSAGVGEILPPEKAGPTGQRAIRSSIRVSAMPTSEAGCVNILMLFFESSNDSFYHQ